MTYREIARFLIVKGLSGYKYKLEALRLYLDGLSPSEVEKKTGVKKTIVRSIMTKLYEKSGGEYQASIRYARKLIPLVIEFTEPIVDIWWDRGVYYAKCKLCNAVYEQPFIQEHLQIFHRDYVESEIERISRLMRYEYINS